MTNYKYSEADLLSGKEGFYHLNPEKYKDIYKGFVDFEYPFSFDGNPYETVEWETKLVILKTISGKVLFERECEFPTSWSENARIITASKYFSSTETSLKQLADRVVNTLVDKAKYQGMVSPDNTLWGNNLKYGIIHQVFSFNSPVWFNLGIEDPAQCSACFIVGVDDNMQSILDFGKTAGLLFKYGSGIGSNKSSLRSNKSTLSTGGTPSGPISFIEMYDGIAKIIKSGGRTRRSAQMEILDIDHPDIEEFIDLKAKEEKRIRELKAVCESAGIQFNEEDYRKFQNSNFSVSITDKFMKAVERGSQFNLLDKSANNKVVKKVKAKDLFRRIVNASLECGDPGLQFVDTMNRDSWFDQRINATNPCVTGDTLVYVADGRCFVPIKKLAEENKSVPVFTSDGRSICIRTMNSIRRTEEKAKILKITLDGGLILRVTENHKLITSDGKTIESKNLVPGSSLRILTRSLSSISEITNSNDRDNTDIYPSIIFNNQTVLEHRLIAAHANNLDSIPCLAGIQATKNNALACGSMLLFNNLPVEQNTWDSFKSYLQEKGIKKVVSSSVIDKYWDNWDSFRYDCKFYNHKVLSIEGCGYEDVYNGTVDEFHNYFIGGFETPDGTVCINTMNCSELVSITNSACNLASINLKKFISGYRQFDYNKFALCCRLLISAMDIIVDVGKYPTKEICLNSVNYRPLGLGYTNLGALCMVFNHAYGDDNCFDLVDKITKTMTLEALQMSTELGEKSFSVIDKLTWCDTAYKNVKNSALTLLAPTGTISFMMDCDTTGIEPELSLVKTKHLAGGGEFKIINQSVKESLVNLGLDNVDEIQKFIEENGTVEGSAAETNADIYLCALPDSKGKYIPPEDHIKVLAAAQQYLNGAISKTVNLPSDYTADQLEELYMLAWKSGIKAIAVYRDQSKISQPMTVQRNISNSSRKRPPATRNAITHKFNIMGNAGNFTAYLTVGKYPDGSPCELFIESSKEGSTISGLLGGFAVLFSLALQHGVPLDLLIEKLKGNQFDPSGFTKNTDIPMVSSIYDYIVKFIEKEFQKEVKTNGKESYDAGKVCDRCGRVMIKTGKCYQCTCGENSGCGS